MQNTEIVKIFVNLSSADFKETVGLNSNRKIKYLNQCLIIKGKKRRLGCHFVIDIFTLLMYNTET